MLRKSLIVITASLGIGIVAGQANAASLDLMGVTQGSSGIGNFEGSLGKVSVTGSLVTGKPQFRINGTGLDYHNSIIDNSSPQFSNSSIYTSSLLLGDKVGYSMLRNPGIARLQINFSEAITNPTFHVANLDSMVYDFSPTNNLLGLSLLSGNGANDGDGLVVDGLVVKDGNPLTIIGVDPAAPVPTASSARSAYGSVQLIGTFTSLDIDLSQNPNTIGGDGGAFTLTTKTEVTTPEPASIFSLLAIGTVIGAAALNRKQIT